MTIKELRKEFKRKIEFDRAINGGLEDYYKTEWATLETLYAEGAVNRRTDYISDDMLALATGYDPQKTDDGFTVVRCLDLAYIYATKKHVRNMMMLFLGITEPEKQQTAEPTAEQKTKEQEQAEQPTAEQQAEEQAEPEEQTTEEQQQLKPRKPKKYHELIDMIINADTESEVSEICYEIDFAYQHDKIKPRENDQLYALINKIF